MNEILARFMAFVSSHDAINDKSRLTRYACKNFNLTRDRSIYVCDDFAVRFSASNNFKFGNTVLSLSNLQKYDGRPFLVCLVTPTKNHLLLSNTTFLKKISHSSQSLRENNIRGSFNGSDIVRDFQGIANVPENFERLYLIHEGLEFEDNLKRLVETTTNIVPAGSKFEVTQADLNNIRDAPTRASNFIQSADFRVLKAELDEKVERFKTEIVIASLIENTNVRGRIIEYLIAGQDDQLRQSLVAALTRNERSIPPFKTDNRLGDYSREFEKYLTETDVKTKVMMLHSNPKAYNIDKMLEFLASERSVFMFYFVGVDPTRIANTVLVSMFQDKLLNSTIVLRHWAGRNSRGVTQLEGKAIRELVIQPESTIMLDKAQAFLEELISL